MEEALRVWEAGHPEQLEFGIVKGFFGARNVAAGKLAKKTSVRLVPAVKDTREETADARRSPLIGILSTIVKQTFENKKEFSDFVQTTNERLSELTNPRQVPRLSSISERLTEAIRTYYADTDLIADLNKADEIVVNFPSPVINVLHRGLRVDVGQVGHGLQRAILFSLVQFLAEEQSYSAEDPSEKAEFAEPYSDIILLVEEPEIYQHPLKQILFYEAFKRLTSSFSRTSGIRVQIIYATHSEKFVRIDDVDKIRLIRKTPHERSFSTVCSGLSISDFSAGMASHIGSDCQPMSDDAFKAGLHIFSREVSEGFFADKVVLVEGVTDKAIIEATFRQLDIDPLHKGISIIQVDGKTKIDKPLFAFERMGIHVYCVFDNDSTNENANKKNNAIKRNRIIQSILTAYPLRSGGNHI